MGPTACGDDCRQRLLVCGRLTVHLDQNGHLVVRQELRQRGLELLPQFHPRGGAPLPGEASQRGAQEGRVRTDGSERGPSGQCVQVLAPVGEVAALVDGEFLPRLLGQRFRPPYEPADMVFGQVVPLPVEVVDECGEAFRGGAELVGTPVHRPVDQVVD